MNLEVLKQYQDKFESFPVYVKDALIKSGAATNQTLITDLEYKLNGKKKLNSEKLMDIMTMCQQDLMTQKYNFAGFSVTERMLSMKEQYEDQTISSEEKVLLLEESKDNIERHIDRFDQDHIAIKYENVLAAKLCEEIFLENPLLKEVLINKKTDVTTVICRAVRKHREQYLLYAKRYLGKEFFIEYLMLWQNIINEIEVTDHIDVSPILSKLK